jgi:hypothetical protein
MRKIRLVRDPRMVEFVQQSLEEGEVHLVTYSGKKCQVQVIGAPTEAVQVRGGRIDPHAALQASRLRMMDTPQC